MATTTRTTTYGKLLSVQAVFRHGARTPLSTKYWPEFDFVCDDEYPGTRLELVDETGRPDPPPYLDLGSPKWASGRCRQGQLTREGYGMALALGRWLRKTYVEELGFLTPDFQEGEVSVRTTCIQRAAQTLQGVVTGLWPDLAHATIKANATRLHMEFMYGNNDTCPTLTPLYTQLKAKIAARDAANSTLSRVAQQVVDALELSGGPGGIDWVRLFDVLSCMGAEPNTTQPLPPTATPTIIKQIFQQAVATEAPMLGPTPKDGFLPAHECAATIRRSVGPLLWRLVANMRAAAAAAGLKEGGGKARGPHVTAVTLGFTSEGDAHNATKHNKATKRDRVLSASHHSDRPDRTLKEDLLFGEEDGASDFSIFVPTHHQRDMLQQQATAAPGGAAGAAAASGEGGHTGQGTLPADGGAGGVEQVGKRRPVQLEVPPKAHLFSGHDSSITPLLAALGKPETEWPPYTAALVFELWGAQAAGGSVRVSMRGVGSTYLRTPVVRVLYDKEPLELVGPGTYRGGFISLSELTRRWSAYMADDEAHAKECWGA